VSYIIGGKDLLTLFVFEELYDNDATYVATIKNKIVQRVDNHWL